MMLRMLSGSLALLTFAVPAAAERIKNPIALFSGLDKVTGITTDFEIKVGEEKPFGLFTVKPFVCFTRPITEEPKTAAFVQVDVQGSDGKKTRIFSGWMFAESPGLNAVEHPIFDVWLTGCKDPNAPPPPVEVPQKPADEVLPEEDTGSEEADEGDKPREKAPEEPVQD
jgi:hypothetical protein